MTTSVIDPESGLPVQVVEPGSQDDPFTDRSRVASTAASTGAPAEPPAVSADGTPVTQPVPQPGSQTAVQPPAAAPVIQPAQPATNAVPPVVEVIPAGSQPTTQPAPAAPVPAAPATPAPDAESLKSLADLIRGSANEAVQEALRTQQSSYDRRAAVTDRQLQDARQREIDAQARVRDLETRDLTAEERATVMARYAQEDKAEELQAWEDQLVDYHRGVLTRDLIAEYGEFGVTPEVLEQVESPDMMEAYCFEVKANTLEARIASGVPAPAPVPAVAQPPAQPGATVTAVPEPQAQAQPEPQVPAGFNAPVYNGAGGSSAPGKEFDQSSSPEAMTKNLRNLGWDTVRLRT